MAGGGEEGHANTSAPLYAIGPWLSTSFIYRHAADPAPYTGNYLYYFAPGSTGASPNVADRTWAAWSMAFDFWTYWLTGTHYYLFYLGSVGGEQRAIGFVKGSSTLKAKVALFTGTTGTVLAQSTEEFSYQTTVPFKWNFNAGVWTVWADMNLDGTWTEVISYDDSGEGTTLNYAEMSPVFGTNETYAAYAFWRFVDDCCMWDAAGNDWNSLIPADDFPRISEAHMPDTSGAKTESHAGQAALIDDIPPDRSTFASIDEDEYYSNVEDFKPTGETIQAVMCTQVAGPGPSDAKCRIFNLYHSYTLYADSAFAVVQAGYYPGGSSAWVTYGGYWPWALGDTPQNWTPVLFNAHHYGVALQNGLTDQMTVQVIFGGSSHWWTPPAPSIGRPRGVRVL